MPRQGNTYEKTLTHDGMFRALLICERAEGRERLARLLDGSDIVIDDAVPQAEALARVALRPPDLIVVDLEDDATRASAACRSLKANPATVFLPLMALARSARQRLAAFDAGVDDFLTYHVRREEFFVRARALLRVSAARRQLVAQQVADEVRRREQIHDAFRRYISPKLADQILAGLRDASLTKLNSRAEAAVMFADMRGFTGLSERLAPDQVVELLNEFFALLTDITFQYDGTVFNMAGDSLMVGFGVPVQQADDAQRAIEAARLMLEEFRATAARWKARYGVDTGLGIGVNVGEVVAGNVGSPAYMNYTLIGDTVNVASRLGQRARAGELLFSDAVKRSLDANGVDLDAQPLPSLVLRGRSSPIDIFCIPTGERVDLRAH
ncbi:MAG: adenylate/guanylate cyclase domain-containing response regulator [Proteobacteria bacterium]|nr:MAG: adenylate/guanylate cyclase domain-containing response regulator [Pseudomonadota bacterium]